MITIDNFLYHKRFIYSCWVHWQSGHTDSLITNFCQLGFHWWFDLHALPWLVDADARSGRWLGAPAGEPYTHTGGSNSSYTANQLCVLFRFFLQEKAAFSISDNCSFTLSWVVCCIWPYFCFTGHGKFPLGRCFLCICWPWPN